MAVDQRPQQTVSVCAQHMIWVQTGYLHILFCVVVVETRVSYVRFYTSRKSRKHHTTEKSSYGLQYRVGRKYGPDFAFTLTFPISLHKTGALWLWHHVYMSVFLNNIWINKQMLMKFGADLISLLATRLLYTVCEKNSWASKKHI
jgi:hypothetical protein